MLAIGNYIPAAGTGGLLLAGICIVIVCVLWRSRKYPAAIIVIALGVLYAVCVDGNLAAGSWFGFQAPKIGVPSGGDIIQGFLLLGLAQIPLSLGNSIYATKQVSDDLYPERKITVRKIGLSYSLLNLVIPFFGGVPVCHGSGGLVGHHTFGGRTGGSVLIYGGMFVVVGLFFAGGFTHVVRLFPLPVLGVILIVEGIALMRFSRELVGCRRELVCALLVAGLAIYVPYGFLVGMVVGVIYMKIMDRTKPQALSQSEIPA